MPSPLAARAQDAKTFRERTVLLFGDEASASDMYFELAAQIRKLEAGDDFFEDMPPINVSGPGSVKPSAAGAAAAASGAAAGDGCAHTGSLSITRMMF